jgi:hypothetical protein
MGSQPTRPESTFSLLWKCQVSSIIVIFTLGYVTSEWGLSELRIFRCCSHSGKLHALYLGLLYFVIKFASIDSHCGLHSASKCSYNGKMAYRAVSQVTEIAVVYKKTALWPVTSFVHINSAAADTAGDCRPQESIIVGVD